MKTPDEIRRETESIIRAERRKREDFLALDRLAEQLVNMPSQRPCLALVPDLDASNEPESR